MTFLLITHHLIGSLSKTGWCCWSSLFILICWIVTLFYLNIQRITMLFFSLNNSMILSYNLYNFNLSFDFVICKHILIYESETCISCQIFILQLKIIRVYQLIVVLLSHLLRFLYFILFIKTLNFNFLINSF